MLLVSGNWINDFRRSKSLHLLHHQSFPIYSRYSVHNRFSRDFIPSRIGEQSVTKGRDSDESLETHVSPWTARFRNSLAGKIIHQDIVPCFQCFSMPLSIDPSRRLEQEKQTILFIRRVNSRLARLTFDPNKISFLPLKL